MSTQITYNNILVLSGQPTPVYSLSENMVRYGGRWNVVDSILLQGVLTGCTYESILSAQQRLFNVFNKDFQNFSIVQDGVTGFWKEYNIIRDIKIENSSWVGLVNYTVSLESQPRNLTSGIYGITSPQNEWTFTETDNNLLEITHKISAKGLNTSNNFSNAFDNCKNYVLDLTGIGSFIEPFFSRYCTGASLCLDSFSENINRINCEYGVTEKYVPLDLFHGSFGYIRETAEYTCDLSQGIATLNLNGEVKSCKNADLNTLRQKYLNYDVFGAAVTAYSGACGRIDLNPNYISSGVNEDAYTKTIGFNIQFDNNFTPRIYFDYSTDIQVGEDDITTVGIKGTIKGRGDLLNKYSLVQDFYNNQLNLFYLANESYKEFCDNNIIYPLNPIQQNYSVSKNPFLGEVSVSTRYNNKLLLPPEFQALDYTLEFKPSITQIRSIPLVNLGGSCTGTYNTISLGFANRAGLSINGRATAACGGTYSSTINAIKNLANSSLIDNYNNSKVCLDKNSINQSNAGKGLGFTFNFDWIFDAAAPAIISPFSFIDTLSLK